MRGGEVRSDKESIMNSEANYVMHGTATTVPQSLGKIVRHLIRLAAIIVFSGTAFAQYGGGGTPGTATGAPGSTTPSYGHGKAIGIGIGAAAAGAGAIYLIAHHGSKISGCVENADDGLHLTDDKTKRTLALVPGSADVKPGERVELKGKVKKNASGEQSFLVKSVAKDLGGCNARAEGTLGHPLDSQAR
jgi:hypothetical protein